MKKRLMSENDTRRMQRLAGMLKESYDGEHLEEKYSDDPIYGDDPMVDDEYSMDSDSEMGLGDDAELTSDDIGLQLPRLDNDSLSDYSDMEPEEEDDVNDPNYVNPAWSRGRKRAKAEPNMDRKKEAGLYSDPLEKAKMYLDNYDANSNTSERGLDELIYDLESEAKNSMDGDVNKSKEIDSVLSKLKSLQTDPWDKLNESRESKFMKFEKMLNEGIGSEGEYWVVSRDTDDPREEINANVFSEEEMDEKFGGFPYESEGVYIEGPFSYEEANSKANSTSNRDHMVSYHQKTKDDVDSFESLYGDINKDLKPSSDWDNE